MAKLLILYDSASGNTAKMAGLIADGAGSIAGIEIRLRKIDEATGEDVLWCDGLALGSPTNMGLLSWKMKQFWDEAMAPHWMKVDGKIACAFSRMVKLLSPIAIGQADGACGSLPIGPSSG